MQRQLECLITGTFLRVIWMYVLRYSVNLLKDTNFWFIGNKVSSTENEYIDFKMPTLYLDVSDVLEFENVISDKISSRSWKNIMIRNRRMTSSSN